MRFSMSERGEVGQMHHPLPKKNKKKKTRNVNIFGVVCLYVWTQVEGVFRELQDVPNSNRAWGALVVFHEFCASMGLNPESSPFPLALSFLAD